MDLLGAAHRGVGALILAVTFGPGVPVAPAAAQLEASGRERVDAGGVEGALEGVASGDFDGDGFADLVFAYPTADVSGIDRAGRLSVLYGLRRATPATRMFDPARRQVLTEDTADVEGAVGAGHLFGRGLATGDFDGDLYDDLAVAVPGASRAANVTVIFGSREGLRGEGSTSVAGGRLRELAAGDFNGDRIDDVVVTEALTQSALGDPPSRVEIYYGSRGGPTPRGAQSITPDSFRDPFSQFLGTLGPLAVGDVEGDGYDDLALGAPDAIFASTAPVGSVVLLRGSPSGLLGPGQVVMDSDGCYGFSCGTSIAIGDFDGDGRDDLSVGASDEDLVRVYPGTIGGGVDQARRTFLSGPFGSARQFFAADVDGDGRDDLVVADPNADGQTGRVVVDYGGAGGLSASRRQTFLPDEDGDVIFASVRFGRALGVADFDGGGVDLVVGVDDPGFFVDPVPAPWAFAYENVIKNGIPDSGVRLQGGRFGSTHCGPTSRARAASAVRCGSRRTRPSSTSSTARTGRPWSSCSTPAL